MKRFATRLLAGFGRGLRNGLVAVGALAFLGTAIGLADYTATQGAGTTFASIVISLKHYAAVVICDMTAGETNCSTVKAASTASAQTDTALVERNPDIGTINDATGCGSSNTVSGCLKQLNAQLASLVSGLLTPPLAVTGNTGSDGSTTITTGGTAQNLFSAATPTNGFEVCNPNTSDDLWISMNTTAAANETGSERVPANGGCYSSNPTMKPWHSISIVGATTADKITATQW